MFKLQIKWKLYHLPVLQVVHTAVLSISISISISPSLFSPPSSSSRSFCYCILIFLTRGAILIEELLSTRSRVAKRLRGRKGPRVDVICTNESNKQLIVDWTSARRGDNWKYTSTLLIQLELEGFFDYVHLSCASCPHPFAQVKEANGGQRLLYKWNIYLNKLTINCDSWCCYSCVVMLLQLMLSSCYCPKSLPFFHHC